MNLKSLFKKIFLGGELIEEIDSPINGKIQVFEQLSGKKFVRVGGITQSGGILEKIWRQVLSSPHCSLFNIHNSLILGLGCGTVAELLIQKWPGIKITGVEIDPEMIKIGKKYFNLAKIQNLNILITDAIKEIENCKLKIENFNLILVDLYLGQNFPGQAESDRFLNSLKKISAKNGLIVFNRLNFGEHKEKTQDFTEKLKNFFPEVRQVKVNFNLFLVCR